VKLSKAGLSYDPEKNDVADRIRDWVVDRPMDAFLFPLFNDRATDIHGLLYYSKNAEAIQIQMISNLLGCAVPTSPEGQKDAFIQLVENTLGEECNYDTVMAIQEKLAEIVEVEKESPDLGVLTKNRVKQLFEESGVSEETMENFDDEFDAATGGDPSLILSNIAGSKTSIKMPDVVVSVDPAKLSQIETREIDGRKYLVIPVDTEVEINGIHLS
ncbi:MAG: DUF4317 family protein, partial [Blautia sp.]|nr:DUF4317 family protein [Blautia sp.]